MRSDSPEKISLSRKETTCVGREAMRVDTCAFQGVFHSAATGLAIVDDSGKISLCNEALQKMLGYGRDEMIGMRFADFIHEDDRHFEADLYKELLDGRRASYRVAVRCFKKGNNIAWTLIVVSLLAQKLDAPYAIRMVEDITDRKRAEDAFLKSRNSYLPLFDELPNPIRRSDTDQSGDFFNKAWLAFTGRTLLQEAAAGWYDGVHPDDRGALRKIQSDAFLAGTSYVSEYRLRNRAGEHRWIMEFGKPFQDIDGNFGGYISSCYDVQERKDFEKKLQWISTTDELTGLLNRRGFFSVALQQIKSSNRTKKGMLLVYADLDGLKGINDSCGHPEGDRALIETAQVLREISRDSDIIARLGGDEFVVLMPEHSKSASREQIILTRLRESIALRNEQSPRKFLLSLSTGIQYYDPYHPCSLDELISAADRLMYREKGSKSIKRNDGIRER